jgi:phospholipase C
VSCKLYSSRLLPLLLLALLLASGRAIAAQTLQPQDALQHHDVIQHIVVIFDENISFDHYFGTYPVALNPPGEPAFHAAANTPHVDGLTPALLTANPNFTNPANGAGRANPFRLRRDQAATADQDHSYQPEQAAFDDGRMDLFPASVGRPDGPRVPGKNAGVSATSGLTLGYYDGNTVTAMWNYAQHYAMSDRHFDVVFGPSTPGAINLISGQTNGVVNDQGAEGGIVEDGHGGFTLIADPDPVGDVCSSTSDALVHMTGPNIGDLLSKANVTWGFFQGGFDLTVTNPNGTTGCRRSNASLEEVLKRDYSPHHEPFQYYKSTANPLHTRPTSVAAIGTNADSANHQYDTHDFFDAINAGNFPAVSYLKAPSYEDAHAGNSTPLDEQKFVVRVINFLEQRPEWKNTLVIIAYDDSDGWYDHVSAPITNGSATRRDVLNAPGICGAAGTALGGVDPANPHAQGRCGPGPRLPILMISPWAKPNFVDHSLTDQTSILRLVEDTFLGGQRIGGGSFDATAGPLDNMLDLSSPHPRNMRQLLLDPESGLVIAKPAGHVAQGQVSQGHVAQSQASQGQAAPGN